MLTNLRKATKSLAVSETAYKLMTRWYYTPSRLQVMLPGTSGLCFRGCQQPGTFRHIFWDCALLAPVWGKVTAVALAITGTPLQLTIPMCLLGATIPGILRREECLIHTICVSTLWAIALHWKSPVVPLSSILNRIDVVMIMERILYTLQDKLQLFDCRWEAWKTHRHILLAQN